MKQIGPGYQALRKQLMGNMLAVYAIPTTLLAILALYQATDALKRRRLRRSVHSARRGWRG